METTSTEAVSTEATTAAPTDSGSGGDIAAAQVGAEEAQYTPNFKFKVMDEEKEIDEFLRGAIKDADTEKKVRELYEKAYGLDHVKPKYESLKGQYEEVNGKFSTVAGDLQKLGIMLKNKDFGSFFNSFQLSDEDILQYALDRLNYYELPPEKRAAMDQQMSRNAEYAKLMQENQTFKQQMEQQQLSSMKQELDNNLNAPHVSPIVQSFDARVGKPGAFMEAVVNYARAEYARLGKDLTPAEAVQSFISTFGLSGQAASQQPVAVQAGTESSGSAQRPATLPKMPASGSSPVKQKVKSLDDLRKLQEQAFRG